jgi:hypothetical protein
MADSQVNIVFNADTAQMTQAFAKLNSELASSSGGATAAIAGLRQEGTKAATSTVNWTQVAKDHAAAQEFMAGKVGKTAADFKAATAEQRAASVATREATAAGESFGSLSFSSLVGRLTGVSAAFELVRLAAEGVKFAVGSSMELESADVRFKSLAGNTQAATKTFEGMKDVADDTQTNVVELSKAGITLLEAGVPMDKINEKLEVMGKQARIAGENVQDVANVQLRLSRGEVSARDLSTISRVTGDETGKLQAQYKDISVTIPLIAKEMERTQRASERTRQDHDKIAVRLEQDNDLLATQAMHDRDLADSRSRQDFDRSESRSEENRDLRERRQIEDWQGSLALGQMVRGGPIGPRFPGGFTPDEGPIQQETHSKFGKGGYIIEGSFERKAREEANRVGFAKEDRAREDRDKEEKRVREDRDQKADRSREDRDTVAERSRAVVNLAAGRGRADSGTQMQRDQEDERNALELRKEREKAQLIEDARNQLAGESDTPVWDAVQRESNYQAYQRTAQGKADLGVYQATKLAQGAGSALGEAVGSEAAGAQAQGEGITADADWFRNLMHMAPTKAQQLGMSEESAKLLIQNTGTASKHLEDLLKVFSTS